MVKRAFDRLKEASQKKMTSNNERLQRFASAVGYRGANSEIPKVCGACGKSGLNLKRCNACRSILYCGKSCQKAHRKAHRKTCKEGEKMFMAAKLMAIQISDEVRESCRTVQEDDLVSEKAMNTLFEHLQTADDIEENTDLFSPDPPRPECPICMLPLLHKRDNTHYQPCCGKLLCNACMFKSKITIVLENRIRNADPDNGLEELEQNCPFCRTELPDPQRLDVQRRRFEERMKLDDPEAFYVMGHMYYFGEEMLGLEEDKKKATELMMRAADLGCDEASKIIALQYKEGEILEKDMAKYRHYLEVAAKLGNRQARHNLASLEFEGGNTMLAVRHLCISAAAGHPMSLQSIRQIYQKGLISREEYAKILRMQQKAREDERSNDRDKYWVRDKNGYYTGEVTDQFEKLPD